MTKNIMIIGGAGFIGSALVHMFVKKNVFSVVVIEPERANIDRLIDIVDKIKIIRTDIKNTIVIYDCIRNDKIDTIIHLASTLIPSSTLYAYQNELTNLITPTLDIIKIASEYNAKFVFFSSGGTIYGNKKSVKLKETDIPEPISYYGMSKHIIEQSIFFEHRTTGLKYLILRPSNPYGPGQNLYGRQGFIAVCLGKIINNVPIEVWGDGSVIRDYLYIDDLSEIVCHLLEKDLEYHVLNIGSGVGYSVNEVIECIKRHVQAPFQVEYKEERNIDVSSMILDIHKLSLFCPYNPLSLDEGVGRFIKYLMK